MKNNRHLFPIVALVLQAPLAAQWDRFYTLQECHEPVREDLCGSLGYVELDYLLWYPYLDGISYGSVIPYGILSTVDANTNPQYEENSQFFKNKWDSGVRASLEYKPYGRTWEVRGIYTYFASHLRRDQSADLSSEYAPVINGDAVIPNFSLLNISFGTPQATSISALWSVNFNQFDLPFGKEYHLTQDMILRPFFGLRGLWLNHHLQIVADQSLSASTEVSAFNAKNYFKGAGIQGGLDTSVHLYEGFDLYGKVAVSLVWGYFKIVQNFRAFDLAENSMVSTLNTNEVNHSHQTSVYNLDLGVGLRWSRWLNGGSNLLTFKFGWEQHIYSNINQIQSVTPIIEFVSGSFFESNMQRGFLSLSGFVFGISYLY